MMWISILGGDLWEFTLGFCFLVYFSKGREKGQIVRYELVITIFSAFPFGIYLVERGSEKMTDKWQGSFW